jgi:hypothetical protein
MSAIGLQKCASIFQQMQLLRIELQKDPSDHQNVLLAQMLDEGKDAMKDSFCQCTMMPNERNLNKGIG